MSKQNVFPGADERSPSRSQYFSWINNTNEGATEEQTLANLEFFRYLHDEFGMVLDIYSFDAGAIDGASFYSSMDTEKFRRQFPRSFQPMYEAAKAMGTRLGVWCGPDGFGDTPQDERKRIETMVSLCRDFEFTLFKLDAVCGDLRKEKQDAFVEMMTRCRQYCPDLIVTSHRLDLGKGRPHATTWLWEGTETYIDTHLLNHTPAPHNRAGALARGLPPGLQRLTDDHGVCLSSCLDGWEDDLVLHAFNRALILSPQLYGNPWLLRDDELPRLARFFNLHRQYRGILMNAMRLPTKKFGPYAVSRGDGSTRFITLRNLTWKPVTRTISVGRAIGLTGNGPFTARRLHPRERILGEFKPGQQFKIEVLPFRSCLVVVTNDPQKLGPSVEDQDFEVVPGQSETIRVYDDRPEGWHRKLGTLKRVPVPKDAEALYEATIFAADNNALEIRELLRSGPTKIPAVQKARDAFFNQPVFQSRHLWDRNLFTEAESGFAVSRRRIVDNRVRGGAFRIDLGAPTRIDTLVLEVGGDYELQPLKREEGLTGSVSVDLKTWRPFYAWVGLTDITLKLPEGEPVRYVRFDAGPDLVRKVRGFYRGEALDRSKWRASNLFSRYSVAPAVRAWSLPFTIKSAAPGSYLPIAIQGECGNEMVYAAVRSRDGYIGAPRRSPSYPCNGWELPATPAKGNYTYYVPVTPEMIGRPLEAVTLLMEGGHPDLRIEAWLTA